ncbi:hypothetical protein ACTHGU_02875 [Chitinophagaceae bacterium MMS25-I14]
MPVFKGKSFFHFTWRISFAAAFLTIIFLGSCNNAKKAPDVSNIKVDIQSRRFDRDLFSIDTNHIAAGLRQLDAKYPDFLGFYLDTLMGLGIQQDYSDTNTGIREGLHLFLTYPDYHNLYDTVASRFPDTKQIDQDITKGLQYVKYYFPKYETPHVVYFMTDLKNWGAITYGHVLGIGLDMYLGPQFPFYASVGIPGYMTHRLLPQFACVNAMKVLYNDMYPFVTEGRDLLDMMVQRGKEQYFLEHVLPFADDTLRLGYTTAQLAWCQENESMIYNYFLKKGLFHETKWQDILRYINEGPNSTGMPEQSPGNIGAWLGYRIVEAYASQHPDMPLDKVLAQTDAQRMLQEAKYRPK